ncbi:MAG: hypothetical protein QOE70_3736 [Chthoniobacter sp.]|jgi:hypothetical protein|nr:hypothetical protein [Chthoniobacter sp.]
MIRGGIHRDREANRAAVANPIREQRRRIWFQALGSVAAIWVLAASVVLLIRATQPSPRKVAAYLQRYGLEGRSPEDRARIITGLVLQMDSLNYEQLRSVRQSPAMRGAYQLMTGAEKELLLTGTAGNGVRQMLNTVARLPSAERERFLYRASYEWETGVNADERAPFNHQRVFAALTEAFSSYYRDLPPEARAEFGPLLKRTMPLPIEGL